MINIKARGGPQNKNEAEDSVPCQRRCLGITLFVTLTHKARCKFKLAWGFRSSPSHGD